MVDWTEWQAIGIAAVTMALALVGIVYAIGIGFGMPKVKSWAKNELYQALASAFILGFLITLQPSINGVMTGLGGTAEGCSIFCWCPHDCPKENVACQTGSMYYSATFDTALCFLDGQKSALLGYSATLAGISLVLGYWSTFSMSVAPSGFGIGFAVLPGISPLLDVFSILSTFVLAGFAFLWAQMLILEFIRLKLMALLPIGVALRSFPFTRGAGAAIIALCVGLYFMFPLMIVLESKIVKTDMERYAPYHDPGLGLGIISSIGNFFTTFANFLNIAMYQVLIVAIFLPVLNLTITFAFMKELARVLGGEIDVSSLSKLL